MSTMMKNIGPSEGNIEQLSHQNGKLQDSPSSEWLNPGHILFIK